MTRNILFQFHTVCLFTNAGPQTSLCFIRQYVWNFSVISVSARSLAFSHLNCLSVALLIALFNLALRCSVCGRVSPLCMIPRHPKHLSVSPYLWKSSVFNLARLLWGPSFADSRFRVQIWVPRVVYELHLAPHLFARGPKVRLRSAADLLHATGGDLHAFRAHLPCRPLRSWPLHLLS